MTRENVLLIGGSGFIGSAIARRLSRRSIPFSIADIRPSTAFPAAWNAADAREERALATAMRGAASVVHLAGEHGTHARPYEQFRSMNVDGARAVANAARAAGVQRIVFTSSAAVYGFPVGIATEDSACSPRNDYGRTKLAAEEILRAWAAEDDARSLTIIRPTVVFGPGIRGNLRALLHRLANPRHAIIGDGRNTKSFASITNVAALHEFSLDAPAGERIFNWSDGPPLTVNEMALVIRRALGADERVRHMPVAMALAVATAHEAGHALFGGGPALTRAQVRRLASSVQFAAHVATSNGFTPEVTLADALAEYARSDLRWSLDRARDRAPLQLGVRDA